MEEFSRARGSYPPWCLQVSGRAFCAPGKQPASCILLLWSEFVNEEIASGAPGSDDLNHDAVSDRFAKLAFAGANAKCLVTTRKVNREPQISSIAPLAVALWLSDFFSTENRLPPGYYDEMARQLMSSTNNKRPRPGTEAQTAGRTSGSSALAGAATRPLATGAALASA
eukprot:CAMPEP_0172602300 /NCGR_PEP_ID=MMETSP1068-20121228/22476_1 /TAXON_ID=35684 /ORGANISM="Pseudopedinella elastica, Strain CCMP716" /LENGTH=168 /DNA_ID=CAMNT_0013403595 /DNA_START=825 /DNA_END=1333 /DNA_ORIENTATION=+